MVLKGLKKIALFLITGGFISAVSSQELPKAGDNTAAINNNVAAEVQSDYKALFPTAVTKEQRNNIVPVRGLTVWCSDCDSSANTKSGQFYVYIDTKWIPVVVPAIFGVDSEGTAIAVVDSIEPISEQLKIGKVSTAFVKVHINVIQAGTYEGFGAVSETGGTMGLSLSPVLAGDFMDVGKQELHFAVSGTPAISLEGNTFYVPEIGKISTGKIQAGDMVGGNSTCDALHETTVVPVNSETGRIWMDRNLGAVSSANSVDDFQAFGCLYQWGRGNDGHASIKWKSHSEGTAVNGITAAQSDTDNPENELFILNSNDWRSASKNDLWQGVSGINNPCPKEYRIPTLKEFETEISGAGIINASTANSSPFKFALPGYRSNLDGNVINAGIETHLWTGTIKPDSNAGTLFINRKGVVFAVSRRSNGYSVRCIKE